MLGEHLQRAAMLIPPRCEADQRRPRGDIVNVDAPMQIAAVIEAKFESGTVRGILARRAAENQRPPPVTQVDLLERDRRLGGQIEQHGEGDVHPLLVARAAGVSRAHAAEIRLDLSGIVAFHQPLGDFAERRVADRLILP